jgi:hypothetical protein
MGVIIWKTINKNTIFYFRGVSELRRGSIDKAFLLIHEAYREDERSTHGTEDDPNKYPAYLFISLKYNDPKQYLFNYVETLAKYLEKRIDEYRRTYSSGLTLKGI